MSLFVPLMLLLVCSAMAGTDDLARMRALRQSDAAASIELGESLLSESNYPLRHEVGLELVYSYQKIKRHEDAVSLADSLLAESDSISANLHIRILTERLNSMTILKEWHNQHALIADGKNLVSQVSDNKLRRRFWNRCALLRFAQFELSDAADYWEKALAELGKNEHMTRVTLLMNLGVVRVQQAQYADGTELLLEAHAINEDFGEGPDAFLLQNMGALFLNMEDWERCIDFTQQAVETYEPGAPKLISLYSNIGAAYAGLDDLETALANLKTALQISQDNDQPRASMLNNLAYVHQRMGDHQQALKRFQQAADLYSEQEVFEGVGVAKKNLGETWIALGDRAKAAELLQESYDLYQIHDYRPKRLELYPVMIDNLTAIGNINEALHLMHEFKALSDEIVDVESQERIAKLQTAYDLERRERELAASELERAFQEKAIGQLQKEKEQQRTTALGLALAVLVLASITLLLVRSVRFRAKANRILAGKNGQIQEQHEKLEKLNDELKSLSYEDALTGLKNRRFLMEFVEKEAPYLARSHEQDEGKKLLLILLDLDRFKRINDQYGHPVGDAVLRAFADVLRSCARESDIIVRWGGEEFCWLCRDTDVDDGPELCDRVRALLAKTEVLVGQESITATASFGFAPYPISEDPAADWERSLKLADTALYEAKEAGRDRWVGFQCSALPQWQATEPLDLQRLRDEGVVQEVLIGGLPAARRREA